MNEVRGAHEILMIFVVARDRQKERNGQRRGGDDDVDGGEQY